IIDSAFSSYRRIAREKLAKFYLSWFSFLFSDKYSPVDWIAQVSPVPVLVIHGEMDTVVPVHHAEALFDAARPPKELWLVPAEGHVRSFANDIVRQQTVEYLERVLMTK
ncbi:MAG TPA: alpha/beta hydrolase, partial [Nitrospirota bacterium]|nr:alpha/beta hydrolase [Nitrospirota bacterium]